MKYHTGVACSAGMNSNFLDTGTWSVILISPVCVLFTAFKSGVDVNGKSTLYCELYTRDLST